MYEVFINNKSLGTIIDVAIKNKYIPPEDVIFWDNVESILTERFIIDFIEDKIIVSNERVSYTLNYNINFYIIDINNGELIYSIDMI